VVITNNSGSFSLTVATDALVESAETLIIQIRTVSTAGSVVATASTVTVNNVPVPQASSKFWIRGNSNSWIDGASASVLRFRNTSSWVDKTGNLAGLAVRNAAGNDWIYFISQGVPTYNLSASTSSVNEGQSVTFTVTTTNFGSGTLYWTNSGTTTGADFTDNMNSGQVTISNNAGSIIRVLTNDMTTESPESIILQLRSGSLAGPVVATSSSVTVNDTSAPIAPSSLTMDRNNLDFYFLPDQTSISNQVSLDVRVTVTTDYFFNLATGAFDHIAIAMDCAGEAGGNNPHCGPIYRNGRNIWVTGRGFFITRSSGVWSEIWNGTSSPVINQITNTSGQTFNPVSGTYTIRIRAGYRAGPFANLMTITITNGYSIFDPVVFQGSAGIGWDWTGNHRVAMAIIASGSVGPNPGNGCTEPSTPGSAYGGVLPFLDFTQSVS
jgi:hypothetical protein